MTKNKSQNMKIQCFRRTAGICENLSDNIAIFTFFMTF